MKTSQVSSTDQLSNSFKRQATLLRSLCRFLQLLASVRSALRGTDTLTDSLDHYSGLDEITHVHSSIGSHHPTALSKILLLASAVIDPEPPFVFSSPS